MWLKTLLRFDKENRILCVNKSGSSDKSSPSHNELVNMLVLFNIVNKCGSSRKSSIGCLNWVSRHCIFIFRKFWTNNTLNSIWNFLLYTKHGTIFFCPGHPLFQGVSHVLRSVLLSFLSCPLLVVLWGPSIVLAYFQSTLLSLP